MQILNDSEDKIYTNFIYSFKTEVTRKNSMSILKYYMNFLGITTLRELSFNLLISLFMNLAYESLI